MPDASTTTDREEIKQGFTNFYTTLYSKEERTEVENEVTRKQNYKKLNEEKKEETDKELTTGIKESIKELNKKKTPEPDGITKMGFTRSSMKP